MAKTNPQPMRFLTLDTPVEFQATRILPITFAVRWSPRHKVVSSSAEFQGATKLATHASAVPWRQLLDHTTQAQQLGQEIGEFLAMVNRQFRPGSVEIADPVVSLPAEPAGGTAQLRPQAKVGNWDEDITDSGWPFEMAVTTEYKKKLKGLAVHSLYLNMRGAVPKLSFKIQMLVTTRGPSYRVEGLPVETLELPNHAAWVFLTHVCNGDSLETEVRQAAYAALSDALGGSLSVGWPSDVAHTPNAWGEFPGGSADLSDYDVLPLAFNPDGTAKDIVDPAARFDHRYIIHRTIRWSMDNDRLTDDGGILKIKDTKALDQRVAAGVARNRLRIYGQFLYMSTASRTFAFDLTTYTVHNAAAGTPGTWPVATGSIQTLAPLVNRVWCDGIKGDLSDSFDGFCTLVGLPIA